ncbi:MAG: alpha/beta hydrolase [Patescibacteria group bacterium]|nr:alpha/beta hydrolase [Patescibacteria group bacterium]
MSKRAFIIHGWGGYPEEGWFPWLKSELQKLGFEVIAPLMPKTDEPEIESWVGKANEVVNEIDENTYFIGHSIGCQAILRFLEQKEGQVGGIILVAPWLEVSGIEEDIEIARPWLETPIDGEKIADMTENKLAIFSDNDPFVPMSNTSILKERFGFETLVIPNSGHFSGDDGITELPAVLETIKNWQ